MLRKKSVIKKIKKINLFFQVLTLVKTCEPVAEMRVCRAPRDWSLLALQNIRTGKSHYLVICRCPPKGRLGKWEKSIYAKYNSNQNCTVNISLI